VAHDARVSLAVDVFRRSVALLPAAFAVAASLSGCSRAKNDSTGPEEDLPVDLLPLTKGATWEYKAKVLRFDDEAGTETSTELAWKTEVVDVVHGTVTAYVLKGWPSDLAAFDTAPQPGERVLLRAGDSFLWGRSRDADSVEGAEGWFTEPLMDGQKICPDPGISYCWEVAQEDSSWTLRFRTGPDEETYKIKRGTGVTHYHYAHHGTTNEVTAELVKFTPGPEAP
jgi:hypothetical protein